jgi:DNA polymerase elongation subunit (family B)
LLDCETLPDLPAALRVWPSLSDYPGQTLKASINSVLCAGWKVHGQKATHCINAWDFKSAWAKNINDDSRVVKAIYDVLLAADVVVTHNGKRFDFRFLQTRLRHHKLPPLPKLVHIDTCMVAKGNLYALNNRLQTLLRFFTDTEKMENGGWDLWVQSHAKDEKALSKMEKYCKRDVTGLEALFNELMPFIKLPNANMFTSEQVCPTCSSSSLQRRGEALTVNGRYQRYQCQECGTWSKSKPGKMLKVE